MRRLELRDCLAQCGGVQAKLPLVKPWQPTKSHASKLPCAHPPETRAAVEASFLQVELVLASSCHH